VTAVRPAARTQGAGILVAMFVAAATLRPQLVGIGPLLPEIRADIGMSHAAAGLLSSLPILCMAVFALPAAALARRLGTGPAVAACMATIAVAGAIRAGAGTEGLLIGLCVPLGAAMGVAGALLPAMTKERFPARPAFATGVYSTGMQVGAAAAAGAAVPLAAILGGWRGTLLAFSAVAIAGLAIWALTGGLRPAATAAPARVRLPLRRPRAWTLGVLFGLQSMVFWGLNAWLAEAYLEHGWTAGAAGLLVTAVNLIGIPASLAVPWFADRLGSRRGYLAGGAGIMLVGLVGLTVAPAGAWGWIVLVGVGGGVALSLALTLPLDMAPTPAEVGAWAGLMLFVGYLLASAVPVLLGAVRDLSGSFAASLWTLAGLCAALLALAWVVAPAGSVTR
jgi:CP family cyanate transporter-like MFS transporter